MVVSSQQEKTKKRGCSHSTKREQAKVDDDGF
jgi:hypothetical protein